MYCESSRDRDMAWITILSKPDWLRFVQRVESVGSGVDAAEFRAVGFGHVDVGAWGMRHGVGRHRLSGVLVGVVLGRVAAWSTPSWKGAAAPVDGCGVSEVSEIAGG